MTILAGIPLKSFAEAKGRLASRLDQETRAALMAATAARAVYAAGGAGFDVVVVTASDRVRRWAESTDVAILDEPPGGGLDGAAAAVVEAAGGAWCILHGDLPLITAADLAPLGALLAEGRAVLAPSRDGGTNVLAATEPVAFAYGPGSFARHLAAAARLRPEVLIAPGLAVELDTAADLTAAARLPGGSWLAEFLV